MSYNNLTYQEAVERTAFYLPNPEGLTRQDAPAAQDKIIIRQNNTIIELLIVIINKIDKIEKPHIPDISSEIEALTFQMAKLGPIEPREKTIQTSNKFGIPRK